MVEQARRCCWRGLIELVRAGSVGIDAECGDGRGAFALNQAEGYGKRFGGPDEDESGVLVDSEDIVFVFHRSRPVSGAI
jgi:hypothetical protein